MKAASLLLATLLLLPLARAQETLHEFPNHGFNIKLFDEKQPDDTPAQVLLSFLPQKGGFSPNVNVVTQGFPGSIEEYAEASKKDLDQFGATFAEEKVVSASEWAATYTATMQGVKLRFMMRALLKDGRIYQVTATAPDASWEEYEAALKKAVDSFELR